MANLSTLFPTDIFPAAGGAEFKQLQIFNVNILDLNNGGQCCLWTVPAETNWARFEVWGGGSTGPGSCCCQQPAQSGGAGAYARKTISVTPGDTYRICAAGTTCCNSSCCGVEGFPSWVQTETATNPINLCARGGPPSCGMCFVGFAGCICIGNTRVEATGSFCGQDFGLPAISGASMPGTCGFQTHQHVPQGPYIGGGARTSRDYCIPLNGCASLGGWAVWPSSGGGGAVTGSGVSCWGHWGAGGLVLVTYG
jgi:hypothetical protein